MLNSKIAIAVVIALSFLSVLFLFGCQKDSGSTKPKVAQAEFLVKNMTCGSCDRAIKTTLEKMDGVELVQADFQRGYASASFNPSKVSAEELVAAINSLGFESRIRLPNDADIPPSPHGVPETKQSDEPKQGE